MQPCTVYLQTYKSHFSYFWCFIIMQYGQMYDICVSFHSTRKSNKVEEFRKKNHIHFGIINSLFFNFIPCSPISGWEPQFQIMSELPCVCLSPSWFSIIKPPVVTSALVCWFASLVREDEPMSKSSWTQDEPRTMNRATPSARNLDVRAFSRTGLFSRQYLSRAASDQD